MVLVWTAACQRAECHPYLEKSKLIVVSGWLYVYIETKTEQEEKKKHKILVDGARRQLTRSFDTNVLN